MNLNIHLCFFAFDFKTLWLINFASCCWMASELFKRSVVYQIRKLATPRFCMVIFMLVVSFLYSSFIYGPYIVYLTSNDLNRGVLPYLLRACLVLWFVISVEVSLYNNIHITNIIICSPFYPYKNWCLSWVMQFPISYLFIIHKRLSASYLYCFYDWDLPELILICIFL